ncbi:hypothetical protein LUZ60_014944 [Juncus effusus]|nr:hypothetical protein LUZ60_014944 [Juncus effusus]
MRLNCFKICYKEKMSEDGYQVKLNVYDLSRGLARQLSTTFLGKAIEAIWHTGIVVYGKEYYFGAGIQQDPEGRTPYGTPVRVVDLGTTHVPKEVFEDYLREISSRFSAETYNLLRHNCNNFSNEVAQFLIGTSIPGYILDLPNEVMNSPMGPLIMPMIQQLETTMRSGAVPQAPQFVPNPNSTRSVENGTGTGTVPPAVEPVPEPVPVQKPVLGDPLGEARIKVQAEITQEFKAIMASGTIQASEAAAMATRRVMEKHGRLNVPTQ